MKRIQCIFLAICLLASLSVISQSKNPYKSIGKESKTLTLTKDKYEEFFDQDSIQQVGSVLVNVRTGKIFKFLEEQEARQRLENEKGSRFLSVDPLQAHYAELTPYQFASNSPIAFMDLDGLERYYFKLDLDSKTGKSTLTHSATDEREGTLLDALLFRAPTGKKITTKDIYVNVDVDGNYNQTLHFNYFSQLSEWKAKGMPVDKEAGNAEQAAIKQQSNVAVIQMQMLTLEQKIDEADGDYDGYAEPTVNSKSTTSTTNKQVTAANGGNNVGSKSNAANVTLKNTTPNQTGKGYNLKANATFINNGKITITGQQNTTGTYDFVITAEGKLVVGKGHYTLSGGAEKVKAAGTLKIVNGQVKAITNSSGHYQPTVQQGANAVQQLNNMGVNTSGAAVTLYNSDGSVSKTYKN